MATLVHQADFNNLMAVNYMRRIKVIAKIEKVKCETIKSPFHPQFEELTRLIAQLITSDNSGQLLKESYYEKEDCSE